VRARFWEGATRSVGDLLGPRGAALSKAPGTQPYP